MKKLMCAVMVVATTLLMSAGDYDGVKRYDVKSGIIKSEFQGLQSGEEILYFDDWGMREAKLTHLDMMGMKQNILTIIDGAVMYVIDLDKNTGTKSATPLYEEITMGNGNWTETGKEMMAQMGGEQTGNKTIAGVECEEWTLARMSTVTWVYKGVTMGFSAMMAGTEMGMMAVEASFDVDVPQDKLRVPDGVTISDAPAAATNYQDLMKNMKDQQERE